jgi:predicted DNA-binding transcriptional regulator YafY
MNKTDRLLAIVLELQRRGVLRAEDLADTFETSVRTIYRDMQALSEAGVPIVGAPGQGYSLMEGYFLPPVSFTVEEAVTLLIGTDMVEHKFDSDYGRTAKAAQGKIEAILSDPIRREATRVRTMIRLLAVGEEASGKREKDCMETLRRAILQEQKVSFFYSKKMPGTDGKRQGVRVVAPYGLVLILGAWVLIAHCDLRNEIRHFRLSRMSDLVILEDRFEPMPDFNLHEYKPPDDRNIYVRIRADREIADRIMETNYFFMEAAEDRPEGLIVTYRVRQPEEILQWILGWGADVVVLEPESLRERVRAEAEKIVKRY